VIIVLGIAVQVVRHEVEHHPVVSIARGPEQADLLGVRLLGVIEVEVGAHGHHYLEHTTYSG